MALCCSSQTASPGECSPREPLDAYVLALSNSIRPHGRHCEMCEISAQGVDPQEGIQVVATVAAHRHNVCEEGIIRKC